MSRRTRETRTQVEQAVAAGERSVEEATTDLTAARVAFIDAEKHYIDVGTRPSLERKRDAGDALERAEALHRRASEKRDLARAALADLVREEQVRDLETLRGKLAQFGKTVEAHAAEFVAIDRAIDVQVMAVAVEVRDAVATYERAAAIARELRLPENLDARPDLPNVCLTTRRLVEAARRAEHRDALATAWLAQPPDAHDWRLRDQDAQGLADLERTRERAAAIEREREQAAAFAAGQKNPPKQEAAT